MPTREAEEPAAERPCTCHPDDHPPSPCARLYALSECKRKAAIDALGGYQRVFDAIGAAVKPWPSKEAFAGISISVFAFVAALAKAEDRIGDEPPPQPPEGTR